MSGPPDAAPAAEDAPRSTSSDGPERTVAPATAIPDFPDLYPRQVTIHGWRVLHLNNPNSGAGNKVYEVNLHAMECSCPDWDYRKGEAPSVCKHMAAAIFEARKNMDVGDALAFDTLELGREVRDLAESLERKATGLQADTVAAESASSQSGGSTTVDASEAAERLQEAYDDAVSGMNVEVHGGQIWVNKSPDAPDYTFEAFLSGPDLMKYDPDESPKEYFNNRIDPSDVDAYIEEVLE